MESSFLCTECSRSCTTQENLNKHVKTCKKSTGKKFQCHYCSKLLSSKQNLKEHEFTHTGELPYICKNPGCGLRFRQGSVLSAHRRIHNVIERYVSQEKYKWVKLTDLIKNQKIVSDLVPEEEYPRVELPPISTPQPFFISRNYSNIEI